MKSGDHKNAASAAHPCVFLQQPFPDCHCMNISSRNIGRMLTFCIGDYFSCPIFLRHSEEEAAAADD